jgi:hypothetical protein
MDTEDHTPVKWLRFYNDALVVCPHVSATL